MKSMKPPEWNIPDNLDQLLNTDEGGIWEDSRWTPIQLAVMKGTSYAGRDIPLAWQIEFEPIGPEFESANSKIRTLGLDADGYGWASLIRSVAEKSNPELARELQFGDTEEATCVVWVETESNCQQLVRLVWSLIYGS